jgi:hypothetical protein
MSAVNHTQQYQVFSMKLYRLCGQTVWNWCWCFC